MMRRAWVVAAILTALLAGSAPDLCAQVGARGFGPKTPNAPGGTRRALMIGISDYEYVRDLDYAARDARAFYAFLRSPAGGSVDTSNIRLLTDSAAKSDAITDGLTWLLAKSQPNDEVIFYFAGHGDVGVETVDTIGYLLPYDAPTGRQYFRRAALAVSDLARFIDGIHKKGATVMVFTDACRSGKLVADLAGAYQTTSALRQYWSGVYKLVSSGEDQLSQEGPRWGGGHGVFTYFLLAGLEGGANENGDSVVTFGEVARFVEASVVAATRLDSKGPPQQVPNTVGTTERPLAWLESSAGPAAAGREPRGGDAEPIDSRVQRGIAAFHAALNAGALLQPDSASAWFAYRQLQANPAATADVLAQVRFELREALQNTARQVVTEYLVGGDRQPEAERIRNAASELALADELMPKTSAFVPQLGARRLFLEGYAYLQKGDYASALPPLRASVALQPQAAEAYNALGFAFLASGQLDSARQAFSVARSRALRDYPLLGLLGLALVRLDAGEAAPALALLDTAVALSQPQASLQLVRALALLELGRRTETIAAFRRARMLDPRVIDDAYLRGLLSYSPGIVARVPRLRAVVR